MQVYVIPAGPFFVKLFYCDIQCRYKYQKNLFLKLTSHVDESGSLYKVISITAGVQRFDVITFII